MSTNSPSLSTTQAVNLRRETRMASSTKNQGKQSHSTHLTINSPHTSRGDSARDECLHDNHLTLSRFEGREGGSHAGNHCILQRISPIKCRSDGEQKVAHEPLVRHVASEHLLSRQMRLYAPFRRHGHRQREHFTVPDEAHCDGIHKLQHRLPQLWQSAQLKARTTKMGLCLRRKEHLRTRVVTV